MKRKKDTIMVSLALIILAIFFVTSCSKKQVKVSEGGVTKTQAQQQQQQQGVEKQGGEQEVKSPQQGITPEYQQRERARQERLRQLEMQQQLVNQIKEFESEKIYFDFDKADLKPKARMVLRKKAAWLRQHPDFSVRIEGNCDERGTNEYNLALGQRRADAAKKFLVTLGVSPDRIITVSYGEERPVDPRHNEEAWAKNRRDEFRLIK